MSATTVILSGLLGRAAVDGVDGVGAALGGPIGFFVANAWMTRPGGLYDRTPPRSPRFVAWAWTVFVGVDTVVTVALSITGWFPGWVTALAVALLVIHLGLLVRVIRHARAPSLAV